MGCRFPVLRQSIRFSEALHLEREYTLFRNLAEVVLKYIIRKRVEVKLMTAYLKANSLGAC